MDSYLFLFYAYFRISLSSYFKPKRYTLRANLTFFSLLWKFNPDATIFTFCKWKYKKLPSKVEYFSKIEEISPYCQNGSKLQISFINLVVVSTYISVFFISVCAQNTATSPVFTTNRNVLHGKKQTQQNKNNKSMQKQAV